ncbi:Uu.00g102160.m01.CDS01 [Anthostomella pinea]|uniref:Uu.00g102160.m01.CDS01 n=1 Tax=Anthostomella pinea TaxID=933095 RepID=A0AAI8VDD4_9PEZI|nr:Uu.00g102160.m01.CDS01 [Anthostomella pinea]
MGKEKNKNDSGSKTTAPKKRPAPKSKPKPPPTPKSPPPASATAEKESPDEELQHQQALLDIFSAAFSRTLSSADFTARLQEVKALLYARDFDAAFGREGNLDVYAARWSPTRALCYGWVLSEIGAHLEGLIVENGYGGGTGSNVGVRQEGDDGDDGDERADAGGPVANESLSASLPSEKAPEAPTRSLRMLSIGGGAAEIVAFASYLHTCGLHSSTTTTTETDDTTPTTPTTPTADTDLTGKLTLLDTGPWGRITQTLQTGLTTAPPPQSAQTDAQPLIQPTHLHSTLTQQDILSLSSAQLSDLLLPIAGTAQPLLITLLFTLNELYTAAGIGPTTAFLRRLTATVPPGSLLLVVDSPGSYSKAAVGREARRYPMQWLLDHTLLDQKKRKDEDKKKLDSADDDGGCRWEKLESHDSVWFRLADGLRYPIALEDMRYQMHLYRACARSTD